MGIKKVKKDMIIRTKSAILAGKLYDTIEKFGLESFRFNGDCCYEGESKPVYSIGFMIPAQKLSSAVLATLAFEKDFKKGKDYVISYN